MVNKNATTNERYVSCNIKGGLGNQLFQIFATIAYGLRTGRQIRFRLMEQIGNRSSYWHSLLKGLESVKINQNDFVYLFYHPGSGVVHHESSYAYSKIPDYSEIDNVLLDGYYQSRNYFEGYEKQILEILGERGGGEKWGVFGRKAKPSTSPKIGMHFRIGDYKHIQHCHPLMPTSYYVNALTQCLKDHEFYLEKSFWNEIVGKMEGGKEKAGEVVYLCEESDVSEVEIHLSVLREEFPYLAFRRGMVDLEMEIGERECDRDWKEMGLLSQCDWFVIPNSSFSWWSATFSSLIELLDEKCDEEGVMGVFRGESWVYYPSVWFGPTLAPSHDVRDMLNQKGWKQVHIY